MEIVSAPHELPIPFRTTEDNGPKSPELLGQMTFVARTRGFPNSLPLF